MFEGFNSFHLLSFLVKHVSKPQTNTTLDKKKIKPSAFTSRDDLWG